MAGEDDISFDIETDVNEADARQSADNLARIFEQAFARAAPKIGANIAKAIEKSFKGKIGGDAFDGFAQGARAAADATRPLQERMEELTRDTAAFEDRVQATRRTLTRIGADDSLFAVVDQTLNKVLATTRAFNNDLERISDDDNLFAGYELQIKNLQQTFFREIAGIQSLTRNLSDVVRIEGNKANQAADRANQVRLTELRNANSRFVVETQTAEARRTAEIRIAGQQQIQSERIRSRTRIELVRFTFRQIQTLERGIAGVFRATGTVANSAFRTLESATSRISGLFRRSNTDLNQGLIGALRARESSIDRSFDRQTRDIRRSTSEQSAIIQRFETQASTGIAGAISGRSALGSLLGGGLAIGGGFALFQGLRDGLEVGGDFVQGLSVLQAQLELTELQMQGVREQSIALGNDIALPGVSALDAAEAIQILAKQFASLGQGALPAAQAAAQGTLQLSRAVGVGAEEAARVVGAAVNVFGIAASEAVAVADQVTNALKNAAGVGFNEFADAFTQSASVVNLFIGPAQEANEALAETNAALALLARGGIIGSDAGTSLKQFFLQANRGTVDSTEVLNEVVARAGELGSVFFDAAGGARTLADSVDILRRGTEGLTDQQFSATLQKLFGSDAARSAAVLIRSTTGELERLTAANLEQGSAAEIAAAQNVGLRGAIDALGSVIETQQIKTYERYQEVLGRVVIKFAELLQAFFDGKGIFEVVRAGLVGIGIGLGALVAAKAAAESVQFLVIALRALATPLGVIVTGIALVAAAFNILRTVSPDFREEADRLGATLRAGFVDVLERAGDVITRIARFVRQRIIPAFVDLGVAALRFVAPALERIGDAFDYATRLGGAFIAAVQGEGITGGGIFGFAERLGVGVRTLGLAVQGFIDVLRGGKIDPIDERTEDRQFRIIILAERIGGAFRQAWLAAKAFVEVLKGNGLTTEGGIVGFAERLGLVVRDVIGRVKELGSAISTAFTTGDFTPLRDLFLNSIGDIALAVNNALEPQLRAILSFISNFLDRDLNLGGRAGSSIEAALTGPFQEAAKKLGFFLGNLVTDPRIIKALGQLVGLAILTGVNFISGFAQGAASNLDELGPQFGNLILGAITAGLKAAFRNPFQFAKILAAALISVRVISAFTRFGEQGAAATGKGFAKGLGRFTVNSAAFGRGLFTGPDGLERQATRSAERAKASMVRVFRSINRDLQRLGQSTGGRFTVIDEAAVDRANQRLQETRERLGQVGADAVLARARTSEAFAGMGSIASGFVQILNRDVAGGFASVRVGAGLLRLAVADAFTDMAAQAGGKAQATGQILGTALMSGVGAALAGKQLAGATSAGGAALGLAGIVGAALLPVALLPGPIGVALGGLSLTVGLLTAAFSNNGEAAKIAAEKVDNYADILVRFGTVGGAITDVAAQITTELLNQDDEIQSILARTGFRADQFAADSLRGATDVTSTISQLGAGLGLAAADVSKFTDEADRLGLTNKEIIDSLERQANSTTGLGRALTNAGVDAGAFVELLRVLFGEANAVQGALAEVDLGRSLNPSGVGQTADNAERLGEAVAGLVDPSERYFDSLGRINIAEGNAFGTGAQRATALIAENIENVGLAVDELERRRTAGIQEQINNVTTALQGARDAASQALESIIALVSNPGDDPFTAAFDDLLQSIPAVAAQIQELLGQGVGLGDQTALGAGLRDLVDQFATPFQQAVAQAITDNPAITPEALRNLFAPAIAEIANTQIEVPDAEGNLVKVNLPQETQDLLTSTLSSLLDNTALEAGLDELVVKNETVSKLQAALDQLNLDILANVYFDPLQIQQAAADLGLVIPLAAIPAGSQFVPAATDALPGISRQEQQDLAAIQAQARAIAEAAAAAGAAAAQASGGTADTRERIGINVENLNVTTAGPATAAGSEVVLALGAVSGGISNATRAQVLPILAGSRT